VHSTAAYCAPLWCRSAHTRLIDPTINDALRIVTGCLRSTPADNLPILASIQPDELRRNGARLQYAMTWTLDICSTQHSPVYQVRMDAVSNRDTHLYSPHNPSVHHDDNNRSDALCVDHQWNVGWLRTLRDSALSTPTLAPLSWNGSPKNSVGPA